MKLLFVYPEHGRRPYFPTAIGYLASAILEVKPEAQIDIVDFNIEQEYEKLEDEFYTYTFISGLSAHFASIDKTINYIKQHNSKSIVVLGGIVVTSLPEKVIENTNADLYVIGEGEKTIQEIISGVDIHQIKGIGYRENGKAIINPKRPLIENLDEIKFPAWHLFSKKAMQVYMETDDLWDNAFPILASRGCPMRCNFCFRNFEGTFRSRSIDNVLDEIQILIDQYEIKIITFLDEYFFANKRKIMDFCNRIQERNMKFLWSCSIRVELASRELFETMRRAGCYMLQVGIESGSQKMLDAMNKKSTVEDNEHFLRTAKECGLYVGANMIIGYPGETPETIKEGEDLFHRVKLPCGFHLIQAFPGTPLWDYAVKGGYITDEIEYLRSSFDSDKSMKINFTEISRGNIESIWERLNRELPALYATNNGFSMATKVRLEMGYLYVQIKRGNIRKATSKMIKDISKITKMG